MKGNDVLREKLAYLALAILVICSSFTPLLAQETPFVYNIHIDIICLACPLTNVRVTMSDETGKVVAERVIPVPFEITLTYTTTTSVNSLTIYAVGLTTFGSYSARLVSGSSIVAVGYGGDYWAAVQLT